MQTALLLRQQIPPDKDRISFEKIEEIDDMWIEFYHSLVRKLGIPHNEIWMWGGGPRYVKYADDIVEKWFVNYPTDVRFDFIFARGGFSVYIPVLLNNPDAFKIYYGAIYKPRFNPKAIGDPVPYDLVLTDSQAQFDEIREAGYHPFKFNKPACEAIFKPVNVPKLFDVVMIANSTQKATKGQEWFFRKMKGTGLSILLIGRVDDMLMAIAKSCGLRIEFTGWIPRCSIPKVACMAKVGVCCSTADSCPRVIPEMLAMNIPIVVRNSSGLFLWEDYFNDPGCVLIDEENFVKAVKNHVDNFDKFNTRASYDLNLCVEVSSSDLANEIMIRKSFMRSSQAHGTGVGRV